MRDFKKYLPYIGGGLVLAVLLFGKNLITNIRLKLAVNKASAQTKTAQMQTVQIQGSSVNINFDTLASAIYYAFYNSNGKRRLNEDEQTAIQNVVKCPKQYINDLSAVYANKYGKILKDDLIDKLSNKEWQSVKNLFE